VAVGSGGGGEMAEKKNGKQKERNWQKKMKKIMANENGETAVMA